MTDNKFDGEFISYALGNISEKMITEAVNSGKRIKINRWYRTAVVVAIALVMILVSRIRHNEIIPLNINTITSAEYSAPKITSTVETVRATKDDVNAWLGFDLSSNLPKELKEFTVKYNIVRDSEGDKTLGIEIYGEVEDAKSPKPQFHITITEGQVLEELLFDCDVTTDINGTTVVAGVIPGETRINRDGEERYLPARYFSLFDVGIYHCTIETQGQISEDAFNKLNNILIDLLE